MRGQCHSSVVLRLGPASLVLVRGFVRIPLSSEFRSCPKRQTFQSPRPRCQSKCCSQNCDRVGQLQNRKPRKLEDGWREEVGDKQTPKRAHKVLQKCVPLLLRGHRKRGTEKRPESLAHEGFPRGNPLCPPTSEIVKRLKIGEKQ